MSYGYVFAKLFGVIKRHAAAMLYIGMDYYYD